MLRGDCCTCADATLAEEAASAGGTAESFERNALAAEGFGDSGRGRGAGRWPPDATEEAEGKDMGLEILLEEASEGAAVAPGLAAVFVVAARFASAATSEATGGVEAEDSTIGNASS